VDLFFVISGFVMVHATDGRPVGAGAFLSRRIARVAPLYWAVTVVVFALALVAPSLFRSTSADPVHLVKSLLFVPYARADGATMPIVFVGWTLNLEMMFYGLFALGLLTGGRRRARLATVAGLVGLVVLGRLVRADAAWFRLYTSPMILEFALGMALAALRVRAPAQPPRAGRATAGLAVATGAIALIILPLVFPAADRLLVAGVPSVFVVGGVLALERRGVAPRSASLKLLGDASYAIYLTHFFVTQAFVKAAGVLGVHGAAPVAVLVACCYGAVTVAGVGAHLLVERPLNRVARALLIERRPRGAAVPVVPGR
jgi:exopolysaccharide production protein ExoZ